MTTLVDDCLLHIFGLLDPLNLVSVAQVCTRWGQLAEFELSKLTDMKLNDPLLCDEVRASRKANNMTFINTQTFKTMLKYIGPHLRSVKVGDCRKSAVFFGKHCYHFSDELDLEELTSIMSQTCTEIEHLKIGKHFIDLKHLSRQLLTSNKKLKTLSLPNSNMMSFPRSHTFDSVEEVVWRVKTMSIFESFNLPFPNLKKLYLIISPMDLDDHSFRFLSDISALTQLEELIICKTVINHDRYEFEDNSVRQLIENCQNLRVVKVDVMSFRDADVASFFTLPKLEELFIRDARNFTIETVREIDVNHFKHLTTLTIMFTRKSPVNVSGLCDAIGKMTALKDLTVHNLPSELESSKVTRKAIEGGLSLDKIVFISAKAETTTVYKNIDYPSPLPTFSLWVEPKGKQYDEEMNKFFRSLRNCSIIHDDEFDIKHHFEYSLWGSLDPLIHSDCNCYHYSYELL